MDIDARKISFIQEYLRIDNEKILNAVENFFHKTKLELFEENIKPMSLKQYNDEIDKALEDEQNNRIIKATDLNKKIEKWS